MSREFLSEVSSYEAVRLNKDGSDSDTGYKNYYLEGKYVIRFWTTVRNDSRYTRRVFIEKTFLNISTGKKFSLVTDDVLKAGETVKVTGYRIYPAFFHICSSWEPVVTWDFFDKKK